LNLRWIRGRIRYCFPYRHLVFIAGTAKVFVSHWRLSRGDRLWIQPAVHCVPPANQQTAHLGMPWRLRRSRDRATGQGKRAENCSFS
jgi:hypothetical protein